MASTQIKRKKTADMPDSPPKRVTRARAAKVAEDVSTKPKITKITTASAKAAADKKRSVPPVKVTKRKTRADDNAEAVAEPLAEEDPKPEAPETIQAKPKGRPKKPAVLFQEETAKVDATKLKGRQAKVVDVTETTKSEAPKTRGRPKKVAEPAPSVTEPIDQMVSKSHAPVKKTTRGRTVTNTTKVTVTTAAPKSTAAQPRKRVKFEDRDDKENVPVPVEKAAPRKAAVKATGLNAKPIRKPAAARSATRGQTDTQAPAAASKEVEKNDTMPLSPKKVIQIAKSDPISEDELAGEKTPSRALSKSPAKRPISPVKDVDGVSKLSFNQRMAPPSPTKSVPSSAFASDARRPPPSPFKDALKSSPKKLDITQNLTQPVLLSSRTPMKSSLLQESPRRGVFADSAMKPVLLAPRSPLKASLLQSPARRPMASPTKRSLIDSPNKAGPTSTASDATISANKITPPTAPATSPQKNSSSTLKAVKSSEKGVEVHVMTDDERLADIVKDDSSLIQSSSPEAEIQVAEASTPPQAADSEVKSSPISEDTLSVVQPISSINEESASASRTLPESITFTLAPAFSIGSASLRRSSMESESSEDELSSPQKITPLRKHGVSTKDFGTPAVTGGQIVQQPSHSHVSFTPLVDQLSAWNPSSVDKRGLSRPPRGVFSLGGGENSSYLEQQTPIATHGSPAKTSLFEDEMAIREDQNDVSDTEMFTEGEDELAVFTVSQDSQASEEYGDENAVPTDPSFFREEQEADEMPICTPANVFTPARAIARPQEMHTVSKVPLRPSAEDTRLKMIRQRSRSLGGPLSSVNESKPVQAEDALTEQPATPLLAPYLAPQTPSSGMRLDAETPGRTVRKGVIPDVLKGAVVHVDVHTTEGANASGIFVDLLTQMGARCVKQWHWNPRAMGDSVDSPTPSPEGSPDVTATKVGITHVVYKDGGKRTLEKVRSSHGMVKCVGVGWVLDCEREDKWLDESEYAIDTSVMPRGGSRRRKSMEPRALANMNGNLIPATSSETPAEPADISPTKEFLTFDTPASRRETFVIDPTQTQVLTDIPAPATPTATSINDDILEDGSAWGSPTTPYYLSKGAKLVQQTCPPKKTGALSLFPVTGNVEDQPDETVRRRLLEARRKSLQWSSRIRSPLGRTVSYGK